MKNKDLICLFLLIVKCMGEYYHNQKLDTNSGIYFEYLYNVRLTRGYWELVTSIDFHYIYDYAIELESAPLLKVSLNSCKNKLSESWCEQYFMHHEFQNTIKQIKVYLEQINKMTLQTDNVMSKKRAAPLGIIGSISKSLFGTLTEEDAERISNMIHSLQKNQQKLSLLAANQTHAVRSGFHNLANHLIKTIAETRENNTRIATELIHLANSTHDQLNRMERYNYILKVKQIISNYENIARHYLYVLEKIIDAIMFGNLGIIHPDLLPPTQLQSAVDHFLNKQRNLIFPVSKENLTVVELSKISELTLGHYKNSLILIMKVPLIEVEEYQLFKLSPYPTLQQLGNLTGSAFLQPSADYLILSKKLDKYTLGNSFECKPTPDFHICALQYPLYDLQHSTQHLTCEASVLTKKNLHENCDVKISSTFKPYWKYLTSSKEWLYAVPKPEQLRIICDKNKPITLTLSETGILRLRNGCIGKTSYATLMGYHTFRELTSFSYDNLPNLNVTELVPILQNVNLTSSSKLLAEGRNKNIGHINPFGLLTYDTTLKNLEQEMLDLSTEDLTEIPTQHLAIATMVINMMLMIFAAGILYFAWKSEFFSWCCSTCCTRREAQEEHHYEELNREGPIYDVPRSPPCPVISFQFDEGCEERPLRIKIPTFKAPKKTWRIKKSKPYEHNLSTIMEPENLDNEPTPGTSSQHQGTSETKSTTEV